MAGGGLVFRLLQVQMSCDRACRVSMRSLMNSHWKESGLRGVLAACREREVRWSTYTLPLNNVTVLHLVNRNKIHSGLREVNPLAI